MSAGLFIQEGGAASENLDHRCKHALCQPVTDKITVTVTVTWFRTCLNTS
jgi:hypothetical protein